MPKLKIRFSKNWSYRMNIDGDHKEFSFDVEGRTVREAFYNALNTHHSFVAPLFNRKGEIEIQNSVILYFGRIGFAEKIDKNIILDSIVKNGDELSVLWAVTMG